MPTIPAGSSGSTSPTPSGSPLKSSLPRLGGGKDSGRRRSRLAQRQHQPVGPIEERSGTDYVDDRLVIEAAVAQRIDVLRTERHRRRGERHRCSDNGVPALVEVGAGAFGQQLLDLWHLLRI